MSDHSNDYLRLENITRVFPGVKALDDVTFGLRKGEVHGLVGENGAGKSTLLKILSGAYQPSAGRVLIGGREVYLKDTRTALDEKIAVIYQELNLVPEMTVAENLLLGHIPQKRGFIDFNEAREKAGKTLAFIREEIDPSVKVKNLFIGRRQMIEIGKALLREAELIAFDEPTSSLSERETERLFEIIAELKRQNKAIIYVSHRMEEIFRICDRVTVFRDGRHIETFDRMEEVSHDVLVSRMVGRQIDDVYSYRPRPLGGAALEVKDLRGAKIPSPASFSLKRGEILGFFGLVGAGRTELMRLIYGIDPPAGGTIKIGEKPCRIRGPSDSISRGLVLLPEDRKFEGIVAIRNVMENINISSRRHQRRWRFFLNKAWERQNADTFIDKLDIKTPSRRQLLGNLSGGNQQKVILARWLSEKVNLLIMDEPTRGIDVGTKNEIYQFMYQLTEAGMSIIFVSSDLPEVMGVSDRIAVMRQGRIVEKLDRKDFSEKRIISLALPSEGQEQGEF